MTVIDRVRKFLTEREYIKPGEIIDDSESLLERGVIDSVGMLNLVEFLERSYSIEIDEDDLMPENFDSLDAIKNYIGEKVG